MLVKCPVCRKGELAKYGEWSEEVFEVTYQLGECNSCGTVMTNPLPEETTLQRFYKQCYDFSWFNDHRWAKILDARQRVREYGPFLGKNILDYGGGFGYFSNAAREKGYHCITYDPYVNEHKLEEGTWDTVVSLHVLEHVRDPRATLNDMIKLLKPDGNLIIAVPNFNSQGYQELGMKWVWAQPPLAHIYHFTPKSIATILEQSGLIIHKIDTCERWDANSYVDIKCREKYHRLDMDWFTNRKAKYRLYQKYIALRNSILRFKGLKQADSHCITNSGQLSELFVIAKMVQ